MRVHKRSASCHVQAAEQDASGRRQDAIQDLQSQRRGGLLARSCHAGWHSVGQGTRKAYRTQVPNINTNHDTQMHPGSAWYKSVRAAQVPHLCLVVLCLACPQRTQSKQELLSDCAAALGMISKPKVRALPVLATRPSITYIYTVSQVGGCHDTPTHDAWRMPALTCDPRLRFTGITGAQPATLSCYGPQWMTCIVHCTSSLRPHPSDSSYMPACSFASCRV